MGKQKTKMNSSNNDSTAKSYINKTIKKQLLESLKMNYILLRKNIFETQFSAYSEKIYHTREILNISLKLIANIKY